MFKNYIFMLTLLYCCIIILPGTMAYVNFSVTIQNANTFDGPYLMGVNMGHSSLDGNWLKFLERLGVNSARLFVASVSNLRTFISTTLWGKNLNGVQVTNRISFQSAISDLRTSNGRNVNYNWTNPVQWTNIFNEMNQVVQDIYGSDENTINKLNLLNINTLVVEHMGCGSASTTFIFQSMNSSDPSYWGERWELYKLSYAMGVWAWNKGVKFIEFYNEPDLSLGSCLTAENYKDYYFIRSLSIQNAYNDLNNANPTTPVSIKIVASAFARITYGGNATRYLGDISVKNRRYMFDMNMNNSNWTNMHVYSYHSYDKIGYDMNTDLKYLTASIFNDTNFINEIPAIITEHNAHTSSNWDTLTTTADDDTEASRLASQIMHLINAKIYAHFVFKFSITPSFAANRDIAKNGIHWGEISVYPYHLSDTTLCAEAMRLLTKLKQTKIYSATTDDTSKYRTYLGTKSDDGFYYLHIVNDKYDLVYLSVDISQWNITQGSQILIESVDSGSWGEISSITNAPAIGSKMTVTLNPYSTNRLAITPVILNETKVVSDLGCTVRSGSFSSQNNCTSSSLYIGTSNTSNHENTAVALIRIPVNKNIPLKQKTILKINVQEVIGGSDNRLLVLGLGNVILNETSASWDALSNSYNGLSVLTKLNSSIIIDTINENFINWTSKSNISIVGHISAFSAIKNQTRAIDITDYFSYIINNGASYLTFLLYRPYRHPTYQSTAGPILADDLSNGSLVKISSFVEIIHYYNATVLTTTSTTPTTSISFNTTLNATIPPPIQNSTFSTSTFNTTLNATIPPSIQNSTFSTSTFNTTVLNMLNTSSSFVLLNSSTPSNNGTYTTLSTFNTTIINIINATISLNNTIVLTNTSSMPQNNTQLSFPFSTYTTSSSFLNTILTNTTIFRTTTSATRNSASKNRNQNTYFNGFYLILTLSTFHHKLNFIQN